MSIVDELTKQCTFYRKTLEQCNTRDSKRVIKLDRAESALQRITSFLEMIQQYSHGSPDTNTLNDIGTAATDGLALINEYLEIEPVQSVEQSHSNIQPAKPIGSHICANGKERPWPAVACSNCINGRSISSLSKEAKAEIETENNKLKKEIDEMNVELAKYRRIMPIPPGDVDPGELPHKDSIDSYFG